MGLVGAQLLLVTHWWEGHDGEDIVRIGAQVNQPAKQIRVKAADIFRKPLSKRQTALIGRLKATADADIDYSDIPPLTDEQLDEMVRGKFYRKPKE